MGKLNGGKVAGMEWRNSRGCSLRVDKWRFYFFNIVDWNRGRVSVSLNKLVVSTRNNSRDS